MPTTLKDLGKEYIPSTWESPSCPFCNESRYEVIERFGPNHRYNSVECQGCGLAYLNPRPLYDEEFLSIAYDAYADNDSIFQKFKGIPNPTFSLDTLSPSERSMLEGNEELIQFFEQRLGRVGRFLDVGCATGFVCLAAQRRGWRATGIDISAPMVDFMVRVLGIPGFAGQYHQTPELDALAPFDVIYCSHVIEHIPNPNEWCAQFSKHLAPDGLLCLQIPANNSPERRLKRLSKRLGLKKDNWELWRTPDHLFEPSMGPLRTLLARNGLEVIDWETYSRKDLLNQSFASKLRHRWLKSGNNLRVMARKAR
jgi:SAM-dependent methyltransferase